MDRVGSLPLSANPEIYAIISVEERTDTADLFMLSYRWGIYLFARPTFTDKTPYIAGPCFVDLFAASCDFFSMGSGVNSSAAHASIKTSLLASHGVFGSRACTLDCCILSNDEQVCCLGLVGEKRRRKKKKTDLHPEKKDRPVVAAEQKSIRVIA